VLQRGIWRKGERVERRRVGKKEGEGDLIIMDFVFIYRSLNCV